MRAFTKLRHALSGNENIRKKFEELKQITNERFKIVFDRLDQLINFQNKPKKKMAFQ